MIVHGVVAAVVIVAAIRAKNHMDKNEGPEVTFFQAAPPPPPPPPPPAGASRPKTKKVDVKPIVKKPDTIVEAKDKEPPKDTPPAPTSAAEPEGEPGGVPGGVAGGVVGGVVGGTVGGVLGNPLGSTQVLPFGAGMARPTLLSKSDPTYTKEAMAARVEGLAIAKCVITLEGSLTNCRLIKALPFMDKAILASLTTWKYTPVMFQGRPVSVDYVINIKLSPP